MRINGFRRTVQPTIHSHRNSQNHIRSHLLRRAEILSMCFSRAGLLVETDSTILALMPLSVCVPPWSAFVPACRGADD